MTHSFRSVALYAAGCYALLVGAAFALQHHYSPELPGHAKAHAYLKGHRCYPTTTARTAPSSLLYLSYQCDDPAPGQAWTAEQLLALPEAGALRAK